MLWIFWILTILAALAALLWLGELLSPRHRAALRFMYHHNTNPAVLCGLVRHDPAPAAYAGDPEHWPAVTIIVPGRNEGHILADTVGSLCRMDYPNYRVVFVDDQSTDTTAEVCARLLAQHPHLQVIGNTQAPPPGWVGKVWAIHQARAFVTTPYVLFTDSDLKYHPQCLRQMMRLALHRNTDLLSLLPAMETHTLGERLGLLAGMKLITTFYPLSKSNDPRSSLVLSAGGFLLFRREAYEAIGRHEAVRQQVIEDIALGTRAKSRGLSVFTVATHDLMTGRMYEGWRDTYRGLKKNAYAGCHYNPLTWLAGSLAVLIVAVLTPLYPLAAVLLWLELPGVWAQILLALSLVAYLAMLIDMTRAVRFLGFPFYCVWLAPVAALFFLTVLMHSMLEHYFGGAVWSGRRYRPEHVESLVKSAGSESKH